MFKVILQTNLSIEVLNIFGHFVVIGNKHLIFILLYRELQMVFFPLASSTDACKISLLLKLSLQLQIR